METKTVFSEIWDSYKRTIIHSIITTFGLDFFIKDQNGGDVDTIHNVRETSVYKNKQNENDYINRGEYDALLYHGKNDFYQKFKHDAREKVKIEDAYFPNNTVYYSKASNIEKNPFKKASLDHIISAKEIHDDPGRVLAGLAGEDLANQEYNYAFTNASINSSMGEKSIEEYIQWRIDKGDPLPEETVKKMREIDSKSRKENNRIINEAYYTSDKFYIDASKAALKLGVNMGIRQAVGFVLLEIWVSCENELKNLQSNVRFTDCLRAIETGIRKGLETAKSKYREILKHFGEGFVAGSLSSLATTLINIFVTTDKNTIRYIRQIGVIVVQAGNILLINPEDLCLGDQLKSATVSIITGVSSLFGIFVGNQIAKTPLGQNKEVGGLLQNFCSALVSGLLACTILILLDRSEFMNKLVVRMNHYCSVNHSLKATSREFTKIAAEIQEYNIGEFEKQVLKYDKQIKKIEKANDEELNDILISIYNEFGISLPWTGDFDSFMENKDNRLEFN